MATYPLLASLRKLITALTPAQKRNFRLYVGSSPKGVQAPGYMRLFDALNQYVKDETQSEEDFVAGLFKRRILKRHELSQMAAYLYEKILESMRTQPESQPARAQIVGWLQDARFLLDKELFAECQDQLKKIADLLARYDYPELKLDLLALERRVLLRSGGKQFNERLELIQLDVQAILEQLCADNELLRHNLALIRSFTLSKPLPEPIENGMQNYLRQWPERWPTMPATTRYRMTIAAANYFRHLAARVHDAEESRKAYHQEFQYLQTMVRYLIEHPDEREENPVEFLTIMVRFLAVSLDMGLFDQFERYAVRLIPYSSQLEYCRSIVYLYLIRFIKSGQFSEGEKYIQAQKIAEQLAACAARMRPARYALICFLCGQMHFICGNSREALYWFELVIQHKPLESLPHLRCAAWFLKLAARVDDPEFEPAPALDALYRWLHRSAFHEDIHQTASLMLRHLLLDPRVNRLAASEAAETLRKLYTTKAEYEPLGLLIPWARVRLNGGSLEQEVRRFMNDQR